MSHSLPDFFNSKNPLNQTSAKESIRNSNLNSPMKSKPLPETEVSRSCDDIRLFISLIGSTHLSMTGETERMWGPYGILLFVFFLRLLFWRLIERVIERSCFIFEKELTFLTFFFHHRNFDDHTHSFIYSVVDVFLATRKMVVMIFMHLNKI